MLMNVDIPKVREIFSSLARIPFKNVSGSESRALGANSVCWDHYFFLDLHRLDPGKPRSVKHNRGRWSWEFYLRVVLYFLPIFF